MEQAMERKIGENFTFINGVILKVSKSQKKSCRGCYFNSTRKHRGCLVHEFRDTFYGVVGPCAIQSRDDRESVIFKRVK